MLSLRIEKAVRYWGRGQYSVGEELEQIRKECSDLAGHVQALSHELHPSILDNLGLATAVKSFYRDVSEQNGVVVDFAGRDIPSSLPRDISLSLFRVIQEAIQNAIKYSGQKHFEVCLERKDAQIELEVRDQGIGFDTTSVKNGGGLGLMSMAERIHQLNGTFKIDSQPTIGTRIKTRVPVASRCVDGGLSTRHSATLKEEPAQLR
jgi:signal transduction histidine kinase